MQISECLCCRELKAKASVIAEALSKNISILEIWFSKSTADSFLCWDTAGVGGKVSQEEDTAKVHFVQ